MQPADLQPSLSGSLIELRPLREDDFEDLWRAASDPQIWEQHPESDRYKRDVFRRFFDSALASKGALVVIDRKSRRIIGSSRFYDYHPEEREIIIGFTFLEKAFWGGTYNRELKTLMLDHAFQFAGRVLFQVGEGNIRSQKALEKIGARFVMKTELPALQGRMTPCVIFEITSGDRRP